MQALSDPPAPSSSLYLHGETWGVSFLILTMVLFLGPVFTLGGGAIYVNKVAVKAKERTMKRMAEELARRCGDAHMPLLLVLVVLVLVLLVVLVLVLLLLVLVLLLLLVLLFCCFHTHCLPPRLRRPAGLSACAVV
eukprot:COSAG01_NODE_876_length_12963_cov_5.315454_9_plen_136_part_00